MASAMPRSACGRLAMYAKTGASPTAAFAGLALPVMRPPSDARLRLFRDACCRQVHDCGSALLRREVVSVDDDVVLRGQLPVDAVEALEVVGATSVPVLDQRVCLAGRNPG